MTTEKEKALELVISQIEKRFGKGSVMKLGESGAMSPIETIPTGSLALDLALGIGGIAAFFSVYGISQLFAGAFVAVAIMASALEFGKLVLASHLQRYWKKTNKLRKKNKI